MDLRKPMQQMATNLGSTSIIPQRHLQELLSNLQALSQMNSWTIGSWKYISKKN